MFAISNVLFFLNCMYWAFSSQKLRNTNFCLRTLHNLVSDVVPEHTLFILRYKALKIFILICVYTTYISSKMYSHKPFVKNILDPYFKL